jgi:CDP-6-deoxy-D-xylo-4-hexulose-3-dehydrase
MIKLVNDTISREDLLALTEWLLQDSTPQLTKGVLTKQIEEKWAKKIGTKYSIYVNSGSSAILLTLSALKQSGRLKNDKVVVSSLSWHTDVSSPMLLGMNTILTDCNLDDLSCDLQHLEKIFIQQKPAVLILVSVLGLVPNMKEVLALCEKYDVILLEDVCESAGSQYENTKLGNFGLASFFSFYYGHHLSTIEGGFINTNDLELASLLLSIRNHGWDRDLEESEKQRLRTEWNINEFESLYKFYYQGFNCRSTDLQAFIGLRQIDRLDSFTQKRMENFELYKNNINCNILKLPTRQQDIVSNFAFPVVNQNKTEIVQQLKKAEIEVRPLIAGSMARQPFWIKENGEINLTNCDIIDKYGFYIPNNQNLKVQEVMQICDIINTHGVKK